MQKIKKRNLWRWITVFNILFIFQIGLSSQIEEQFGIDSTKTNSTFQDLKMIIKTTDTTLLVPVDSISYTSKQNKLEQERDPKRAWWYSAILPGLGQAYNRKHWKIPIIYTVFIGSYFMIEDNNYKYKIFKEAYKNFDEHGAPTWNPTLTEKLVKEQKDFFKRNRDFSIIIGVMMYFMNIIDASVDANLMDFDISDDISMRVSPELKQLNMTQENTFGLKFVITLNK